MSQTIFADYPSNQAAERALERLAELGYDNDEISIITRENRDDMGSAQSTGEKVMDGAGEGAATGGLIGGLAGLLAGAGVIPALAGLLIGGPLAAALGLTGIAATTLSGAVTGAVAGGLIGALTRLGLNEEDAKYYSERIDKGGVLLAVDVDEDDAEEVEEALMGGSTSQTTVADKDDNAEMVPTRTRRVTISKD